MLEVKVCNSQSNTMLKKMVSWLLEIPVMPQRRCTDLGFYADLNGKQTEGRVITRVSNILGRSPDILNFRIPAVKGIGNTVYVDVSDRIPDTSNTDEELLNEENLHLTQDQVSKKRVLENILGHFPILSEFMSEAQIYCSCRSCRAHSNSPSISWLRGRGCVRTTAFEEALTLVAHGIADGFGVHDVSAMLDATSLIEGMVCLLQELCEDNRINWDTWFSVAACTFLGCPFQRHVMNVKDGGTTFAAIQYGNLAAIAPWLDLSQQLVIERCFYLLEVKGRVGVISYDTEDRERFQSVEDEYAVIQTEKTEDTRGIFTGNPKNLLSSESEIRLDYDDSAPIVDFVLVPVDDFVYRLLMRVQTHKYSRIVDSSDTMRRVTRTLPLHPRCKHPKTPVLTKLDLPIAIYSFDEVIGRWNKEGLCEASGDGQEETTATYHVTERLTTHFQQNLAMALSVGSIAAVDEGLCFACLLKEVEQVQNPPDRQDHLFDRYLIVTGSERSIVVHRR